jgi:hypothetical protein
MKATIGRLLLVAGGLLAYGTSVFAQDQSKVGLTMGFPAQIGVIFHVSDKVAIRPEVNFTGNSADVGGTSTSSWVFGLGVSALCYVSQHDHLRTYIAPRLDYSHGSTSTSPNSQITLNDTSRNTWGGAGSFGAQYALSDRFSVFGEAGFGVSHASTPLTATLSTTTLKVNTTAWGTRGAVGVIFYP